MVKSCFQLEESLVKLVYLIKKKYLRESLWSSGLIISNRSGKSWFKSCFYLAESLVKLVYFFNENKKTKEESVVQRSERQ